MTLAVSAAGIALVGCSSSTEDGTATSTPQATTTVTSPPPPTAAGVSPGGVTTAVDAPAESTEEEYFQACNAARLWINDRGGERKAQVEPYLAALQTSDSAGPGTFDTPWSQLAPARQSAVIVAAEAGADELCG